MKNTTTSEYEQGRVDARKETREDAWTPALARDYLGGVKPLEEGHPSADYDRGFMSVIAALANGVIS